MFGNLYIVICWSKQALVGVYSDEEDALKIANSYADFHGCAVNVQKFDMSLGWKRRDLRNDGQN